MANNYEMYARYLKISNTLNKLVKDKILDKYDDIDFLTPHGDINFFILGRIFDLKFIANTNVQTYERMFGNDIKAKEIKESNPFSKNLYEWLNYFSCEFDRKDKYSKTFTRYLHYLYRYLKIDDSEIQFNHYRYEWADSVHESSIRRVDSEEAILW